MTPTDAYAVIGNPISQSKLPLIHQTFTWWRGVRLASSPMIGQLTVPLV